MTINVNYQEQPIESITLDRSGFQPLKVDRAESGKIRIGVMKEGVQSFLMSDASAEELIEALELMLGNDA